MDEDVFLVDDDDPRPNIRVPASSAMGPVIDLTAEDSEASDVEDKNSLDLSSDDDLVPVNINATFHSNGVAESASFSNFSDDEPSTSYIRVNTPPLNGLDTEEVNHDDAWPLARDTDSENGDIGWPPATNGGSDNNSDVEDVGWPPAKDTGSENSDKEEEPASQRSLVHYHPLSDSDQSDTAPPPAKKIAKKTPATSKSKAKETSPPKRKRRTAEEKAEEAARKEASKREREVMKRLRPEHCQKYIVVEVDSSVLQIPALHSMLLCPPLAQLKNKVLDRDVINSVSWYREVISSEGRESKEYSDVMLQVLPMQMVEDFVYNGTLCEHVATLHDDFPGIRKVAFIVFDCSQYFKNNKKKKDGHVTREQLEEAIAECQVEKAATFRLLDTAQEVAEWIYRYSKSFAEHPFKASKQGWQEKFRFHLAGEKGDSLRVGSAINDGMPQMWVRTLRKLRRATAEACEAIAAQFPTPTALIIAYEDCACKEEARKLLQNVEMQRGAGPMAASRKIGPVLSRKIHTLLTSTQPTALLADTQ